MSRPATSFCAATAAADAISAAALSTSEAIKPPRRRARDRGVGVGFSSGVLLPGVEVVVVVAAAAASPRALGKCSGVALPPEAKWRPEQRRERRPPGGSALGRGPRRQAALQLRRGEAEMLLRLVMSQPRASSTRPRTVMPKGARRVLGVVRRTRQVLDGLCRASRRLSRCGEEDSSLSRSEQRGGPPTRLPGSGACFSGDGHHSSAMPLRLHDSIGLHPRGLTTS